MNHGRHCSSFLFAPCALLAAAMTQAALAEDQYQAPRARMVTEQIERRGIQNRDVLRVMRATPRHLFVPADVQSMAYRDHPLPIGHEATISQPYIVALMTELLQVSKKDRVLEIGAGSGYQAAVLAQLVSHVYTIEIVPELARSAAAKLRELGYTNVTVKQGDGYQGWPEEAPFERIILTAAPPEIPEALIRQLAPGGRLVAPIGSRSDQELIVIDKRSDGTLHRRNEGGVRFVPMQRSGK